MTPALAERILALLDYVVLPECAEYGECAACGLSAELDAVGDALRKIAGPKTLDG